MPLELSELTSNSEFRELTECEFTSFENPHSNLLRLYFPVFDGDREKSLEEATERQIQWHNSDPHGHWIVIKDTTTNKVVAAANWEFFDENPYAKKSDEECSWFPAGEDREMANLLLGQFFVPRMAFMAKPHACKTYLQFLINSLWSTAAPVEL